MNTFKLWLMKQQFFMTHKIRQTDISALLDSCITKAPSVKILCPQKNFFLLYIRKNTTFLRVGLLRIGEAFSFSCKIVNRWVTTFCCFCERYINLVFCLRRGISEGSSKLHNISVSLILSDSLNRDCRSRQEAYRKVCL